MRKKFRLLFAVTVCIAFFPMQTRAQTRAIRDYSTEYLRTASDDAALFNGRIQAPMPDNTESLYLRDRTARDPNAGRTTIPTPVSPNASYSPGNLLYDGVFYVGVRLRLDLCRDELVAAGPTGSVVGAVLDPERLEYADLKGWRIIRLSSSSPRLALPEGYYLQLHAGRCEVLKKESYDYSYSQMKFANRSVRYYIVIDGIPERIRGSKGSVLGLLRDRRAELDRFVRTNGLDFRHDTENAIVAAVREYERLTQ